MKKISVVIPVYNEEKHIQSSIAAIAAVLDGISIQYCFILVDDGSRDRTWEQLEQLCSSQSSVHAIRLSRNFGKEAALCAGLEYADGSDAVIVMDSDLQHPPELIPQMVELLEQGYDIVDGVKSDRGSESLLYKVGANTFYSIFYRLAGIDLRGASDFKLISRKALSAWRSMPERDTFFRGMSAWVGFKRCALPFEVARRVEGTTKFSFTNLTRLFVAAISSFSSLPLQIITITGGLFFIASFLFGLWTLYMKFSGQALDGFTTVILLQLIIGSTVMFGLGVIGIYLARIYNETKRRPRYLVGDAILESETQNDTAPVAKPRDATVLPRTTSPYASPSADKR